MIGSLLVPVQVEAKKVGAETKVPQLDGDPFNKDATLEKGIHLHWALPDALTRARILNTDDGEETVFPGVPDLWLVVRFNSLKIPKAGVVPKKMPKIVVTKKPGQVFKPGLKSPIIKVPGMTKPPGSGGAVKFPSGFQAGFRKIPLRSWRAWVVDSRAETDTPLEQWTPSQATADGRIHTVPGLLPSAEDLGMPGWGRWEKETKQPFQPATAAYYPQARKRFGFRDDLKDMPQDRGAISYTVIGWYSRDDYDPLATADDREGLLERWKWEDAASKRSFAHLIPQVIKDADLHPSTGDIWIPSTLKTGIVPTSLQLKRRKTLARKRFDRRMLLGTGRKQPTPGEIICHGSVIEIKPAISPSIPTAKKLEVSLAPSIKRALAQTASGDKSAGEIDYVESILQDLDHQAGTESGLIDLPGAAHALSFQGHPGKSSYYAQIDIHEPGKSLAAPWSIDMEKPQNNEVSDVELKEWMAKVRQALRQTLAAVAHPINTRRVRVFDRRPNAQPAVLGPGAAKGSPGGAAWWLDDIEDEDEMRALLLAAGGARIDLPHAEQIFEVPGPRWYRPWSPQIILKNAGRIFRFGYDGRFDPNGRLRCRLDGSTLTSLNVYFTKDPGGTNVPPDPPVLGRDLLFNPDKITNVPGLPAEVRSLLEEALLLDASNAALMAQQWRFSHKAATVQDQKKVQDLFTKVIHGIWELRELNPEDEKFEKIKSQAQREGLLPSPIAITPWQAPWAPLFVDAKYALPYSSLENDWKLGGIPLSMNKHEWEVERGKPVTVEMGLNPEKLKDGNREFATPYKNDDEESFEERAILTTAIQSTLESAFFTNESLNKFGKMVPTNPPPNNSNGDKSADHETFKKLDLLSAALNRFDAELFAAGKRERTGALRLDKLHIVDVFGSQLVWKRPEGKPSKKPFWTPLTPRLPYWSRLQFRLTSAENSEEDASAFNSPVCGYLLPDMVEHSLEVYDAAGKALGQLRGDPPQKGDLKSETLTTWFELLPWIAQEHSIGDADDPLVVIQNQHLRDLVEGVTAQETEIPATAGESKYFETALTALLRVIDTIRTTIDQIDRIGEPKLRLIGNPIAVVRARMWLEATGETNPAKVAGDPPLLSSADDLPTIQVKVGDESRPDDGVLGCFMRGDTPENKNSRFAPVSAAAVEKARLKDRNGVREQKITHPFINQSGRDDSIFPLHPGEKLDLTILQDLKGGIYVTSGVLPRKQITIPKGFLQNGVRGLEPTFRVGPFLAVPRGDQLNPILPVPNIDGYDLKWVRRQPLTSEQEKYSYAEQDIPPLPQVGGTPLQKAVLSEGWLRMVRRKDQEGGE